MSIMSGALLQCWVQQWSMHHGEPDTRTGVGVAIVKET